MEQHQSYEDAFSNWRSKLRTCFKNSRAKIEDNPEILAKRTKLLKRKSQCSDVDDDILQSKVIKQWGVPHFLPPFPDGEDEGTMSAHAEKLKGEHRLIKERRDVRLIRALMDITFADRRNMIVKKFVRIDELVSKYPLLCSEDQVFI